MPMRTSYFLRSPPERAMATVTLFVFNGSVKSASLAGSPRVTGLFVKLKPSIDGTWFCVVLSVPFERPSGARDIVPGIPKPTLPISPSCHNKRKEVTQRPVSSVMKASARSKPQTTYFRCIWPHRATKLIGVLGNLLVLKCCPGMTPLKSSSATFLNAMMVL